MEGVGSNFQVKRDPFCEGNHTTETIRQVILTDRKTSMVAAGR